MTATDTTVRPLRPASTARLTFVRLIHSEWIKLATLRAPWISVALAGVMTIGLGMLVASATADGVDLTGPDVDAAAFATQAALAPTTFTVLLAAILGATLVGGEYSSGMMRSTLTAAPVREKSLLARAVVVAGFVFVTSLLVFLGTALAIAPILGDAGISFDLADPGVTWIPLIAGGAMMAVIALLGMSFGYLLRNGPGAIAAAVATVFVLPLLPLMFPEGPQWQWVHHAAQYLPTSAGAALMTDGSPVVESFGAAALAPAAAALTLAGWALAAIVAAIAVLKKRDV